MSAATIPSRTAPPRDVASLLVMLLDMLFLSFPCRSARAVCPDYSRYVDCVSGVYWTSVAMQAAMSVDD